MSAKPQESLQDNSRPCPDCERDDSFVGRRTFLKATAAGTVAAVAAGGVGRILLADEEPAEKKTPETLVKVLYDTLTEKQRGEVCFDWDYVDAKRDYGLLRTRVSNNWEITRHHVLSDFYTAEQKQLVREIWEGIINPEWHSRVDKQLKDDSGGPFGAQQSIAIFGKPGEDKFQFAMTGRHMTLRCDGNSADHVAFGGPIFYGHAASGFDEKPGHPGNVYWPQAQAANKVYEMLDERQRKMAAVPRSPDEEKVGFLGTDGALPGIPLSEMSSDQRELVQQTLGKLIEPYRQGERDEVLACLKAQGGLDACSLAFYTDSDFDKDGTWDNWRLEGPSFVWYFRGIPHVHVWAHIADDPDVELNTA